MSLNNVKVFQTWAYKSFSEVIAQQIELFNAATNGGLILNSQPFVGDFSDTAYWKIMNNMVRRRDPRADGAVAAIDLAMIVDTMVKVGSGTPPINIPPSMFTWILKSPEEGGAVIGQQLAQATMADMVNTAIATLVAALSGVPAVFEDISAETAAAALFSPSATNKALMKLGDRRQAAVAWLCHSKAIGDYFGNAIGNASNLYKYDTINVVADPFGNRFVISDSPSLVSATDFFSIALQAGAAVVARNDDFIDNIDMGNGRENITRSYQAEWSHNHAVKGFAWNAATGGAAPNNAALASSANWKQIATSHKDLAGVLLKHK